MTSKDQRERSAVTPKSSPPPALSPVDPLTAQQWRTFFAIADALVPAISSSDDVKAVSTALVVNSSEYIAATNSIAKFAADGQDRQLIRSYLEERPSQNSIFRESVYRTVSECLPDEQYKALSLGLTLLNYRIAAPIFTRSLTPFADQPLKAREEILQSWSNSNLSLLRLLFKQFSLLVKQIYAQSSTLLHNVLGFPRVPVHGTPGQSFDYQFIELPPLTSAEPEVFEVDAVIIGSGCGGGIVASNLAAANMNVMVVDKGYFWPADHLPMTEAQGFPHLFHNGGFLSSDDGSIGVTTGQVWGGGGTVNWSASLQPQDFVRKEWAEEHKLPLFQSQGFQNCLDAVCERMGVSTEHIEHNKNNRILLDGARRLGMTAKPVPQNTGGKKHYCGYCTLGCSACEKQGPVVSFLPDAARNGANFMEGFEAEKVVFETNQKGHRVATGVVGVWTSRDEHGGVAGVRYKRRVHVKAKRVIVSGGSVLTPILLKRSGLRNKHIGKNLKLHPVCAIGAIYDEEIRPWEGGILTAVVSSLDNMDQKGHGVRLEAMTMLPSTFLPVTAWRSGLDWKTLAPKLRNMSGHISLCRDTSSGTVYPDPVDGRPRIAYTPNAVDRGYILAGMVALARINYISGAQEIFSASHAIPHFVRQDPTDGLSDSSTESGVNDKAFNEWLDKLQDLGLKDPDVFFLCAHQMGSCRMGASPARGAVDMYGRTWEADNLYVADASVFPSASGVNPMVTNMAISQWISRHLAADFRSEQTERARM